MNRFLLLFFILFGLSISSALKAETVLYCQSELATGFIKENGTWKQTKFEDERFTVKFNDNFTKLKGFIDWVENREMECSKPYSDYENEVFCVHLKGAHETFFYNSQNKRFIASLITSTGWFNNGTDTDVIFAGTCQNF